MTAARNRASYWKTTALSALGSAGMLVGWLLMIRSGSGFMSQAAAVLLIAGCLALAVVTLGGIVVLYRDKRDAKNEPDIFHRLINRPPSPLTRLFGPVYRLVKGRNAIRPGDTVRIRRFDEILATLDDKGQLDHLPFMPEMLRFCGRTFCVHRRIDKINDMIELSGLRRVDNVVTLKELRCDGSAHDGCQAECQLLWHEKWLVRIRDGESAAGRAVEANGSFNKLMTRLPAAETGVDENNAERYVCQATELRKVSRPMSKWDLCRDLRPLLNGTVNPGAFLVAGLTAAFNAFQEWRGGVAYPAMPEQLKTPQTPVEALDLHPGERVAIKSRQEIAKTLYRNHNRGMWFGKETLRFCGKVTTVRYRVRRIINERNGEMIEMKTPCVVLEDCKATGEFLGFCPQNEHVYWREIWLRRAPADGG